MLAWQWRDLAAAGDALSEAFAAALARWLEQGIPDSPEAWLVTVARRELLQDARRARASHDPAVQVLLAVGDDTPTAATQFPDARSSLMFVCAHPAAAGCDARAVGAASRLGLCGETALRRTALKRAAGLTQARRVREHLLAQLAA